MMNEEQENYRPRSPDLSAYTPQPPTASSYNNAAYQQNHSLSHRGSYDASPYFSPQTTTIPQSYFNSLPYAPPQTRPSQTPNIATEANLPPSQTHPSQPQSAVPADQTGHTLADYAAAFEALRQRAPELPQIDVKMARRRKSEEMDDEYAPNAQGAMGGRMSKRPRKNDSSETSTIPSLPLGSGPSQGIEVRTKFPVARIKRIMQADEDVGKLAMAAPIAVCKLSSYLPLLTLTLIQFAIAKALELFMISLVTKAAAEAKEKSSKRVTAMHIKQTIEKDQTFDFLIDTISKVSDQPEGRKGSRARSESPDPPEDGKKKKGGGRRKKTDSEE